MQPVRRISMQLLPMGLPARETWFQATDFWAPFWVQSKLEVQSLMESELEERLLICSGEEGVGDPGGLGGLEGGVEGLEGGVEGLEEGIGGLEGDVGGLEGGLAGLEGGVGEGNVSAGQAD